MEVVIAQSAEGATEIASGIIARLIHERPAAILGLATGRTMEMLYSRLVKEHRKGCIDFSRCQSFNLDEYVGLAADDPRSYRSYMNTHLFRQVNIDHAKTFLPDGMAPDLAAEAERYEQLIKSAGGINLQLLGIGNNGHIGFNEPMSALLSRTRDKSLSRATREQNAAMFGGSANNVPLRALTMGIGTILDARELVLLATGVGKADVLARAIEGPITSMISASAIQLHPRCRVVLDSAAASRLTTADYHDWVVRNEPEMAWVREISGRG